MDFFKSVFSADPEPEDDQPEDHEEEEEEEEASSNPNSSEASGSWGFGGLIKTLATRSESVIQTYRRDLEEFGSGLKKETEAIKEVASRAVRDLPGSLEAGASVAQGSLETVGQTLDEFGGSVWRGTVEIISQSKEALLAADSDADRSDSTPVSAVRRYSRFEAQVVAVQNDPNTFVEEMEDKGDFEKWRSGFRLEVKEEEIEVLLYENGVLEGFFEKFVPGVVDQETFWSRYFYRVHKLQQAEDARAKLVKRVISAEDEEELSWEVDDDEEEEVERKSEIKDEIVGTLEPAEPTKLTEEATREEIVETSEKSNEEATKEEIVETSEKAIASSIEEATKEEIIVTSEKAIEEARKEDIVETSDKPIEEAAKEEIVVTSEKAIEEARKEDIVETLDKPIEEAAKEEIVETSEKPMEELRKSGIVETSGPQVEKETAKESDVDNLEEEQNAKSKMEDSKEPPDSSKSSDFSVISSQPSMQEEDDLGWDEIEDLGEHDDGKVDGSSSTPKKVDLRKRLSAADDDEDLSWDIEDDENGHPKP